MNTTAAKSEAKRKAAASDKPVVGSLHVEKILRTKIKPNPRNSRTHSEDQVMQIADSMIEYGWTFPLLIDEDDKIIAGEGRWLAAGLLIERGNLADKKVPCIRATGWSAAQKRAYVIADNKLTENSKWDFEMLAEELSWLDEEGFDLDLTGFSGDELADLLADKTAGLTDPDDVPEVPDDPVTVLGDTWLLGKHRLRCGDSTSADDVAALLAGVEPHLMVTDPPYGVEYSASWRDAALGGKAGGRAIGKVSNDATADWREAWALFTGDVAYVWHDPNTPNITADSLIACGFEMRVQIIWAKNQMVIGRGHYHGHHESCWYAVRKGKTGHWSGDRKQTTLWQIDKPRKSETGHSTQKPVECMRRPIVNNSSPGQAVYEPFSGSGTTIIAGEMEGRAIYAMEISPAYVDVAVIRWQDFTGEKAVLEGGKRSFDAIKKGSPKKPEKRPRKKKKK